MDLSYYAIYFLCWVSYGWGRVYYGKEHMATQKEINDILVAQVEEKAQEAVKQAEPTSMFAGHRNMKRNARSAAKKGVVDEQMGRIFLEERGFVTQIVVEGKVYYGVPFCRRWTITAKEQLPALYEFCRQYFLAREGHLRK